MEHGENLELGKKEAFMREVNLMNTIRNFDGTPMDDINDPKGLTVKRLLLICLGGYPGKDETNKFIALDLGIKIAKHKGPTILLENNEWSILLESVKANPFNFPNISHVQVWREVQGAKDVNVEKKEEK